MNYEIRSAEISDIGSLSECFKEFCERFELKHVHPVGWAAKLADDIANNPLFNCLVACNGKPIAGVGAELVSDSFSPRESICYIRFLYCLQKYAKTGVWIRLLNNIEEWARDRCYRMAVVPYFSGCLDRHLVKKGFRPVSTEFIKEL